MRRLTKKEQEVQRNIVIASVIFLSVLVFWGILHLILGEDRNEESN